MDISSNDKVNQFLTDTQFVSPEQFEMVIAIRDLFLDANKDFIEDIKYGGLVFMRANTLIGGIYTYKEHISIEFSNGADFEDIDKRLEGKGKKRRHLKIGSIADITNKNSAIYIGQAASV